MAVQEKIGMPLDEFIELGNENPFEIINGERIPKLPNLAGHNFLIRLLFRLLSAHTIANRLGECFFESTYVLPDRYDSNWVTGSRIPDLMFVSAERWASYKENYPHWRDVPLLLIPDFVIEIIAPTDLYSQFDEKVDCYLADGIRRVVVVDPWRHKVIIHTPDRQPLHLSGDAQIDLSDVIPDLIIPLASLFE